MRHTSFVIVPIPEHAFFEKTEFKRLLRDNLFEILGLAAQFWTCHFLVPPQVLV